jgi:ubiquinone/menaquinone biosynthesis C-methylase UbiE
MPGLSTMQEIITKIKTYRHDTILDAGTGKGQFIPDIKKIFPGYKSIVGVDPDSGSIKQASDSFKAEGNIFFEAMD